ncbi:hypothetical protein EIN_212590 [Entamoeba invadens IP1]|uniref:Uncharacterized protein n=1 Tax=Entamoeba invadens IP1 TaxID=370355 RepID=A0A0A1TZK7_ENTIV|nr:hypothetical protein EIN_212590 [Entamoeba invadens IP1]ELP84069.1 hypothetical protein EIN_212590 [Entamoeba invadens IP1]|eukprot:XP_004183415.1 hypothetical protein EIN_212590 [Entamoeba invadens IP1]
MRCSQNENFGYLDFLGMAIDMNETKDKIFESFSSSDSNKKFKYFLNVRIYLENFKNFFENIKETFTDFNLCYYCELQSTELIKLALKMDEGDKTKQKEFATILECLNSSLFLTFAILFQQVPSLFDTVVGFSLCYVNFLSSRFNTDKNAGEIFILDYYGTTFQINFISNLLDLSCDDKQFSVLFDKSHEITRAKELTSSLTNLDEIVKILTDVKEVVFEKCVIFTKPKDNWMTQKLFKLSSFIKTAKVLTTFSKKVIIKNYDEKEVKEWYNYTINIFKLFLHFFTNTSFYLPEYRNYFNMSVLITRLQNEWNLHKRDLRDLNDIIYQITFVVFNNVEFSDLFFEIIVFMRYGQKTSEHYKEMFSLIEDYYTLLLNVFNSKEDTTTILLKLIHSVVVSNNFGNDNDKMETILMIMAKTHSKTYFFISLLDKLKETSYKISTRIFHDKNVDETMFITVKTLSLFSESLSCVDPFVFIISTFISNTYKSLNWYYMLIDPINKIQNILESYLMYDKSYLPRVLLRLVKTVVLCILLKIQNKNQFVFKFKMYIFYSLNEIKKLINFTGEAFKEITLFRKLLSVFEGEILKVFEKYDPFMWKGKVMNHFINFIHDFAVVTSWADLMNYGMNNFCYDIIILFHSKDENALKFETVVSLLYKAAYYNAMLKLLVKCSKCEAKLSKSPKQMFEQYLDKFNNVNSLESLTSMTEAFVNNFNFEKTIIFSQEDLTCETEHHKLFENISKCVFQSSNENNSEIIKEVKLFFFHSTEPKYYQRRTLLSSAIEVQRFHERAEDLFLNMTTSQRIRTSGQHEFVTSINSKLSACYFDIISIMQQYTHGEYCVSLFSPSAIKLALKVRSLVSKIISLFITTRFVSITKYKDMEGIIKFVKFYNNLKEMGSHLKNIIFSMKSAVYTYLSRQTDELSFLLEKLVRIVRDFHSKNLIHVKFHTSVGINYFLFNHACKDSIAFYANLCKLSSTFHALCVSNNSNVKAVIQMKEKGIEFLEKLGFDPILVERVGELSIEDYKKLDQLIGERVDFLVFEIKPSFYFMIRFHMKTIDSVNRLFVVFKHNKIDNQLCSVNVKKLQKYLTYLVELSDALLFSLQVEDRNEALSKMINEKFTKRFEQLNVWISHHDNSDNVKEFISIMGTFEMDVLTLFKIISFVYFLHPWLIDELTDFLVSIANGIGIDQQRYTNVEFLLRSFQPGSVYKNKVMSKCFKSIRTFFQEEEHSLKQIPYIHTLIEEIEQVMVTRKEIVETIHSLNLTLLFKNVSLMKEQIELCCYLSALLTFFVDYEYTNPAFRSGCGLCFNVGLFEETLIECEKKLKNGKSCVNALDRVRHLYVMEFSNISMKLSLQQLCFISQCVENFDVLNFIYLENYVKTFTRLVEYILKFDKYTSILNIHEVEIVENMLINVSSKFSLTQIQNDTSYLETLHNALKETFIVLDTAHARKKDNTIFDIQKIFKNKFYLYTSFEDTLCYKMIHSYEIEKETLDIFNTIASEIYETHKPTEISLQKETLVDINSIVKFKLFSHQLYLFYEYKAVPETTFIYLNKAIFVFIEQLNSVIATGNYDNIHKRLKETNKALRLLIIGNKIQFIFYMRQTATLFVLEEVSDAFKEIWEVIKYRKCNYLEDLFSFGRRFDYIQLLSILSIYGIITLYKFCYCSLKKMTIAKNNLKWIPFVSVMQFLSHFQSITQIEVDILTKENFMYRLRISTQITLPNFFVGDGMSSRVLKPVCWKDLNVFTDPTAI